MRVRDADDHEAWDEFVALYTPLIFGYAIRRGLQQADAADLAQDVMLIVARSIGRFEYDRKIGAFRAWLFTVTGNRLKTLAADRQKRPLGSGDSNIQRMLADFAAD
jgi:RNA polymerase sigma-70 factor (ECF subfamily)